jgi:hypothetical protein
MFDTADALALGAGKGASTMTNSSLSNVARESPRNQRNKQFCQRGG